MITKSLLHRVAGVWVCLLLALPAVASNSDLGKEKRWAEQVVDGLLDGDAVWLLDDIGHEFLGILTEGDTESGRAVILVHGIGVHPNWPDVIYPLREGLLERDLTTLSIQMPVMANNADPREYAFLFPEVPGRFITAIEYLQDEGYRDISIVAHSMGTTMAAFYLASTPDHGVRAFVAIGMGEGNAASNNVEALKKIDIDIFDLYGSQDLAPVRANAAARAAAAKGRSGARFDQVEVPGAGHFFEGHEETLKQKVIEWLQKNAS